MKKIMLIIFLLGYSHYSMASLKTYEASCEKWPGWFQYSCQRVKQIWYEGTLDAYATGYAWHNRFTYPSYKIAVYNEMAWGGGLGRGLFDEQKDWHGLIGIAFLDSHKNVQPAAGYAYQKMSYFTSNIGLGAGLAALVTMRSDIFHGIPFPGILPLVSLHHKELAFFLTYIPGSGRVGNVLFLFAKWTINDLWI